VQAIRYPQQGVFSQFCHYRMKLGSHISAGFRKSGTGLPWYYNGLRSFLLVTACYTAVKRLGLPELGIKKFAYFLPLGSA
jgi:hypothetical protein